MHARRGTPRDPSSFAVMHPAETGPSPGDAVGHCSAWGPLYMLLLGEGCGLSPPSGVCWPGPTSELLAMGYPRPLLPPEPRKQKKQSISPPAPFR